MKAVRTWIVIADGAKARFLLNRGPGKGLEPAEIPDLSVELAATHEIGADRPGRVHDRFGPGRHAMAPRADWHQQDKALFAGEVARILNRAAQGGAFDRLVLVAPAKTLGELRHGLDAPAAARVTGELTKDLIHLTDRDLPEHLETVIAL